MTQDESAPVPVPEKKKSRVLIVVLALLVLGGGAGGGAYFLMAGPSTEKPFVAPEPGLATLDTFVVNLADPGGRRFLRVALRLVLETQADAEKLAKDEVARTRVRSAILEHLALQTADSLVTPAGKAALKQSLAERAGTALGSTKVIDVLFTEFVVQF